MEKVRVQAAHPYDVYIGRGILNRLPDLLGEFAAGSSPKGLNSAGSTTAGTFSTRAPLLIVTDTNVARHYLETLIEELKAAGFETRTALFPPGEMLKSKRPLFSLLGAMVRAGLARDSAVIALGGGVVGDFAGFAASIYMRGCGFIQVPTSLLAQVDSSVGGKVGINLREGKNLVGSFSSPLFVLCDTETLETLPDREVVSGLVEVIKYGLIRDPSLFGTIEMAFRESPREKDGCISPRGVKDLILARRELLHTLVTRSVRIKGEIVGADERESKLRMILNFGHTFGHAVEQLTRYRRYLHGEAVLLGMKMATELSTVTGMLDPARREEVLGLLDLFRIPSPRGIGAEPLCVQMGRDKKKTAGTIRFVLLGGIGKTEIVSGVETTSVTESIDAVLRREKRKKK